MCSTFRVPGAYLLDIKWNGKPLKCCPFKIDVKNPVYPDKVGVTGEHLKGGVIGKEIDLKIDPREAGHGKSLELIRIESNCLWYILSKSLVSYLL